MDGNVFLTWFGCFEFDKNGYTDVFAVMGSIDLQRTT
jgi:hypothetical protein